MSTSGAATVESRRATPASVREKGRPKRKRFVVASLILLAALGYMIYSAVASNSEYYLTVSEVLALGPQAQQSQVKIGGKLEDGTIAWDRGSSTVRFTITDGQKTMHVTYKGVVPDSFQPGADVILDGKVQQDGTFAATTVLAKCASKYEPQIPGAQ